MEFDLTQTDALLSTTRAVRKRLDLEREVPTDIILECLRLAVQAPTGSNAQGWRWMVVTDPATRAALADIYRRGAGDYFAQRSDSIDPASQTGRVISSAGYLAENLQHVPVHVIPMIIGKPDGTNAQGAGLYGSIIPAVWTADQDRIQLAETLRGLHPERASRELKQALRLSFENPSRANTTLAESLQMRHQSINALQDRIEELDRTIEKTTADVEALAASSAQLALRPATPPVPADEMMQNLILDLEILAQVHDDLARR